MLKYVEAVITFAEIPDEITLCINISNCPCKCPGCHSKYLWEPIGENLTNGELHHLISKNRGISCVCFMGGDSDPAWVNILGGIVKHLGLKSAWYSGRSSLSDEIDLNNFDFVKLGPYVEELGPLNSTTTNQKLFKVVESRLIDITSKFWTRPI